MEQCAVAVAKPVYASYVTSLLMALMLHQQRQCAHYMLLAHICNV